MKREFKIFILGLTIGATFMSATTFADGLWDKIDVFINGINVKVNGETVTDDNFLYNDTTYLPLRTVAEMLGVDVTYDEKTNTAYIGKKYNVISYNVKFDGYVIGKIDGEDITEGEWDAYVNYAKANSSFKGSSYIIKEATDMLTRHRRIMIAGQKEGIFINKEFEDDYNNQIRTFMMQYRGEDGFEAALAEDGMTASLFRRFQEISYIESSLISKNGITASYEEAKNYYNDNKEAFRYDGLRVKHILIKTIDSFGNDLPDEDIQKAKETAENVLSLAISGTDFDLLISQYNQDEGMTYNPDGYVFGKGEMIKEFEDAAYALDVGEISPVIKTRYGYHILKLEEKIEYLSIDDGNSLAYAKNMVKNNKLYEHIKNSVGDLNIVFD